MKKFEIFKAGRKTFITIGKAQADKETAITIANNHFKVKRELLEVECGRIKGNILIFDKDGSYWVISRRAKG